MGRRLSVAAPAYFRMYDRPDPRDVTSGQLWAEIAVVVLANITGNSLPQITNALAAAAHRPAGTGR
jgi:hypothetical protein